MLLLCFASPADSGLLGFRFEDFKRGWFVEVENADGGGGLSGRCAVAGRLEYQGVKNMFLDGPTMF